MTSIVNMQKVGDAFSLNVLHHLHLLVAFLLCGVLVSGLLIASMIRKLGFVVKF